MSNCEICFLLCAEISHAILKIFSQLDFMWVLDFLTRIF